MPIKKSYLEQKRYYRVAKVLFWIIPFLAVLATLLNGIDIPQESIFYAAGYIIGWIGWRLQKDIVYIAIGLILYFLIMKIVWRTFLYIAFGGLEDDTKKKKNAVITQSVGPAVQPASEPLPIQDTDTGPKMGIIFLILIIGFIAIYFMESSSTQERQINSGRKNSVQRYCNPGYTYNYSSSKCCPNSAPHYYPGTHGISAPGCYASCPYIGDCSSRTIRY